MKKTYQVCFTIVGMILFVLIVIVLYIRYDSQRVYTAKELQITEQKSKIDFDMDGIDDYTDILIGAREYIATKPNYKSKYYKGGYPNDGCGVCTDVIWNAFENAGYDLKKLVDDDIAQHLEAYNTIQEVDTNIDFRRVKNLNIFFKRKAQNLTLSLEKPEKWQAGDIVVFENHIAICSDKRNAKGIPFIIHHGNWIRGAVEANEMEHYTIIGHFRWNTL